jgi:hypothetical protein
MGSLMFFTNTFFTSLEFTAKYNTALRAYFEEFDNIQQGFFTGTKIKRQICPKYDFYHIL